MRETRSTQIELNPKGCVIVRMMPGVEQTVEDARENTRVSVEVAGGVRERPLLVDIRPGMPLSSEVRFFYTGGALADNFLALALLVEDSPLGEMMGNVFSRMMNRDEQKDPISGKPRSRIETRVFTDEESAVDWLATKAR
jgi:hypothetical protein